MEKEKYKIYIGKQITSEKTLEEVAEYIHKLAEIGMINIEVKEIEPINSTKGIKQRAQAREKMLKNSMQTVKQIKIKIDPKIKKLAEKPRFPKDWKKIISGKPKRKRRTKEEMITDREKPKEPHVRKLRTNLLFSEEVDEIIKENWKDKRDVDLLEIIKEKLGQTFTYEQIKTHRRQIGCVKARGGQTTRIKNSSHSKKYNDEVVEFLRDNINNYLTSELLEMIEGKFNIKTTIGSLQQQLSRHGIKRDEVIKSEIDKEIVDYVLKSKQTDAYVLRDDIIEKFEKDTNVVKLREIMSKRKLDGEDVNDEVKRVEKKRETFEDDKDIDEMGLDD